MPRKWHIRDELAGWLTTRLGLTQRYVEQLLKEIRSLKMQLPALNKNQPVSLSPENKTRLAGRSELAVGRRTHRYWPSFLSLKRRKVSRASALRPAEFFDFTGGPLTDNLDDIRSCTLLLKCNSAAHMPSATPGHCCNPRPFWRHSRSGNTLMSMARPHQSPSGDTPDLHVNAQSGASSTKLKSA